MQYLKLVPRFPSLKIIMDQIDEIVHIRIFQYLNGELDETGKSQFEKDLMQDKALQEEFSLVRELRFAHKNAAIIKANQTIVESVKDIRIQPDFDLSGISGNRSWISGKWKLLLLGGMAIAALLLFFWQKQSPPNTLDKAMTDNLVATKLQPLENNIGYAPGETSLLALGMEAYDRKDYEEAVGYLARYTESTPDDHVRLYLAICLLFENRVEQAEAMLEDLAQKDNVFSQDAKWYLALAYLKNGKALEAKSVLKKLANDTQHGSEAARILEELR